MVGNGPSRAIEPGLPGPPAGLSLTPAPSHDTPGYVDCGPWKLATARQRAAQGAFPTIR